MISVMRSALLLLLLSSGGEGAMTADGAKPAAVAQAPTDEVAPGAKDANRPVASTKRDRTKTALPCTKIKRSPFEPPAEIDPVPPPVEGTEPAIANSP